MTTIVLTTAMATTLKGYPSSFCRFAKTARTVLNLMADIAA